MQFISEKKYLIFSILFFFSTCVLLIFLYKSINVNKENIRQAQDRWQEEELKRNNLAAIFSSLKKLEPDIIKLEEHFVRSSDIVPFLDMLESSAKKAEVKAEVTSVDASIEGSSLSVDMKISGMFENVYKLILLLENSPYNLEFVLVDIKNTSDDISTVSKNKKASEWSAILRIKLLSFIN